MSEFDMFNPQEEDEKSEQQPQNPAMVTMTQEQFDAIINSQNEERKRNQEMWGQLLEGRAPAVIQQQPAIPQPTVNLEGLPDPRIDPEGYHKGLGERLSQTMADMKRVAIAEATNTVSSQQQTVDLLNRAQSRLIERHPDLEAFPEIVEQAANSVFGEMRGRGADPLRILAADMDTIVDNVAERGMNVINKIRGDNQQQQQKEPANRTTMLANRGTKPARPVKEDKFEPNDFVSSLQKLQYDQKIY